MQSIVDGGDKDTGSLKDYKIGYRHVDLLDNQAIDWVGVEAAITAQTKMIAIQRSKAMQHVHPLQLKKLQICV